jgi:hypothetical protein
MRRPEPPERLTAAEKVIWREITEKVRGGLFYSSEHLLEAYVCTLAQQQQIQGFLQQIEPGGERYIELMRLQLSVTALAGNLATKLRLTPRSTFDRYAIKAVPSQPRPWDDPPAHLTPNEPIPPLAAYDSLRWRHWIASMMSPSPAR